MNCAILFISFILYKTIKRKNLSLKIRCRQHYWLLLALKSFKPGSAPGPSGLRAEHIKAAVSSLTPNRAQRAISTLTNLVNALATGRLPPSIAPHFFGANLFAALKKDGGFRPVAVGETLRRLTSKGYAFEVSSRAADLLKPLQLAVGVKGGCESPQRSYSRCRHSHGREVHPASRLQECL